MTRSLTTKRVRPIGAAEVFATIGILVMAASFMGVRRDRPQHEPLVPEMSVTTRGALSAVSAPSEVHVAEPPEHDAKSDLEVKRVALTDRSE